METEKGQKKEEEWMDVAWWWLCMVDTGDGIDEVNGMDDDDDDDNVLLGSSWWRTMDCIVYLQPVKLAAKFH